MFRKKESIKEHPRNADNYFLFLKKRDTGDFCFCFCIHNIEIAFIIHSFKESLKLYLKIFILEKIVCDVS